jgi:hypothetical protein
METTANRTVTKEKIQTEKVSSEGTTSRAALVTFITGAIIVFSFGIYYCYSSGHKTEAGILAVAILIIGLFASRTYKSFK